MGSKIYHEVHENTKAFFSSSSSILLDPLAHGSGNWSLPREDCINSIVTGSILTVSQARSHVSNDNSLWHMCLSQMSEMVMEIRSMQRLLGNHKMDPLQFYEHCIYGKQHRMKLSKVVRTRKVAWTASILINDLAFVFKYFSTLLISIDISLTLIFSPKQQ